MNCQSTVDLSITYAKRRATQRMVSTVSSRFTLGVMALAGLMWLPLPARAVDGCLLVLCQGAPDWRVIPECVPPMLKALDDLARGIPFPPCGSAEEQRMVMSTAAFLALVGICAPQVDPNTAAALVAVESSLNPHAIGVVHGALDRQPRHRGEALATARMLEAQGWNYSVGLAQINARNFERLGLTVDSAFEPCTNLAAMQTVLTECFERTSARGGSPQRALRQALSCYYSGNVVTGFRHGYVREIVRSAIRNTD